jgi:hydroxypyruvate isomerase
MPNFAANLSMMFTEHAFLDRFDAAAQAGFAAVEYLFPYEHAPEEIAKRLERNRLTQALFNMPPGDFSKGERGLAALPDRYEDVKKGVETALVYARATGVKRIHLMAGLANPADPEAQASYRRAISHAGEKLAESGVALLLEPINTRNIPGYFLCDFGQAESYVAGAGLANVRLQFDAYHRQIIHGDVTMGLKRYFDIVDHVQIASVPSRHEPDGEELNFPFLFETLDAMGYAGFVGCEYMPRGATADGLGWFAPYRRSA